MTKELDEAWTTICHYNDEIIHDMGSEYVENPLKEELDIVNNALLELKAIKESNPSKALEELEVLKEMLDDFVKHSLIDKAFNTIKQALQRLEAIDNSNPSEALECLEKLKGMEISSMPFSDEYGTQEVDLNDIRKVGSQLNTDFREYTATIKQALLKAQEPKQYLKWEDLEFKENAIYKRVVLNGELYLLKTYKNFILDFDIVELEKTDGQVLFHINQHSLQLFNDLHLERVEE